MRKKNLGKKDFTTPQIKSYTAAVRRGKRSQHVLPSSTGWVVKRAYASRPARVFDTQTEAVRYGKKVAKKSKASVYVHSKSGRIRERYDMSH